MIARRATSLQIFGSLWRKDRRTLSGASVSESGAGLSGFTAEFKVTLPTAAAGSGYATPTGSVRPVKIADERDEPDASRSPSFWVKTALIAAAGVAAISGVSFNRLAGSRLSGATLNDLRAVSGGLSGVGFFAICLQLTIVGAFAGAASRYRLASRCVTWWFVGACLLAAVAAGAAAAILIDSDGSYRLQMGGYVVLTVGATLASVLPRAEILAGEQFLRLAALYVLGPLIKIAIGLMVLSDEKTSLVILPLALAECVSLVAAFMLRPQRPESAGFVLPVRSLLNGLAAAFGLLILFVFSSLALRSRFGPDANVFNDSATVVRPVVFLPLVISILFLPSIARSPVGSPALRRSYLAALAWTSGLALIAGTTVVVAPHFVTTVLLDDISAASPTVIRLLAVAWVFASISVIPVLQYIAHGSRLALASWGAALVIGVGQLTVSSAVGLAWVTLLAAATLFVAVFVPAILRVQPVLHAMRAHADTEGTRPLGDITLVIPSYNPGPAVIDTIVSAHECFAGLKERATIIVVTDGSTDGSDLLIDSIDLPELIHIRHPRNMGKGAALRTGFSQAETDLIAFIDADGDLPPSLFVELLRAQQHFDADIVFGSKLHPESVVDISALRHIYSTTYRLLMRVLFQLDIRDTQTGIKLFRRDVIKTVLPTLRENAFALDLELFIAARAAGFTNYVEVPVVLRRQSGSTISLRGIGSMFGHTLRLFWRAKITLAYTRSAASSVRPTATKSGNRGQAEVWNV